MHPWPAPLAVVLLVLLTGSVAQGEVYRWVDDKGTVHYSDEPRENRGRAERVEIRELNSADSVDVSDIESGASSTGEGSAEVTMYSASWCGYCDKARAYFERNDIPFTEYDVEDSRKGRRDHEQMDTDSVPVILVGDKRMVGFSAERFERVYDP